VVFKVFEAFNFCAALHREASSHSIYFSGRRKILKSGTAIGFAASETERWALMVITLVA
jgi:hypothetical protein